jgi:two-component system, LytTR family, response regulator
MNGIVSLELMIQKYIPEIKVVAKTINAIEGIELIDDYRPDIVFLDINMPNLNGFELLERVEYRNFQLIFTTAHEEYALRAIKKNALDYLLKPVDSEELKKAIERAKENLKKEDFVQNAFSVLRSMKESDDIKISVPGKSSIDVVSACDIMYVEANSNQAVVVLKDKSKIQVSRSLKDYDQQLCGKKNNFIRLHNSFIVNVDYVMRYVPENGGYVVIQNDKTIPVSKNKKEEFLAMINFKNR